MYYASQFLVFHSFHALLGVFKNMIMPDIIFFFCEFWFQCQEHQHAGKNILSFFFFPKILLFYIFTLPSMIHFELNFVKVYILGQGSVSFQCVHECPIVSSLLTEKIIFCITLLLHLSQKLIVPSYVGLSMDSVLFHGPMCLSLYWVHTLLMTAAV